MTNFEKWKKELTVEEVADRMEAMCYVCGHCPAKQQCDKTFCRTHFLAWANAPMKSKSRMKMCFDKWKDKMADEELRLFVFSISNVMILIAVPFICAFFGVEPENRIGAAGMSSVIFSLMFLKWANEESK